MLPGDIPGRQPRRKRPERVIPPASTVIPPPQFASGGFFMANQGSSPLLPGLTGLVAPPVMVFHNLRPAGSLDFSGASESHRAAPVFHQDRHLPQSLGKFQHFFQVPGVLEHVPVIHLIAFLPLDLPGPLGEGSAVLAKNDDLFGQRSSPLSPQVIHPDVEIIHQVQHDQGVF